ncbi:hypothetical protein [Streptomyces sp. Rer75]|uniref:hypothetical protein n=1 Tax=Streptomyces sp. Rer75 TaxID=2750011 RepID=UPI0015CFCA70|nr:hypothetical protein [Streptomyces sp. Rer75]QLH20464.1 hypothetical protein HYQ63_07265 [Streptomyces sp. Rer75]
MRARFESPRTADARLLQGADALKEGGEYVILELFAPHGKSALFRIEHTEGEGPALFDSRLFTVISPILPPTWRYVQFDTGSFALRPEPWSQPGFWESYFDHEPQAREVFEAEKRKILASS